MNHITLHHQSTVCTRSAQFCSILLYLIAVFVFLTLTARPAQAATVIVTNTLDAGSGSLRQAVSMAAPGDTISFSMAVFNTSRTITLTDGQIVIAKSLTIDGTTGSTAMPTLSGNELTRIFLVNAGVSLTLNGVRIADGQCSNCDGGGISNAGTLNVSDSVFTGNAAASGGGISNLGTLNVSSSTFTGNTASGGGSAGGAIANHGMSSVINSTFVEDSANFGGALYNDNQCTMTVANSTLSGNSAPYGGGGIRNWGTMTVRNTILTASVSGGNCSTNSLPVTDDGHNLDSGSTCGFSSVTASLSNTDPVLGPLQVNRPGLALPTLALLPGSPAIDAGNDMTCLSTDERGVGRPVGAHCDIGAYEASVGVSLATPTILAAPSDAIVIDFSEPVVTTTVHIEISPTMHLTATWGATQQMNIRVATASYTRVTIAHDPFATRVLYALRILPGGKAVSGMPLAGQTLQLAYYPYRVFAPVMVR